MISGLLPRLTKSYILRNVGYNELHSQIKIFAEFLGLAENDISECIHRGLLICSPLRTDNSPTCSFYIDRKGVLRFRDWAGYFWGDCFDSAAYRLLLDTNNGTDFNLILESIAKRFKIHRFKGDFTNGTPIELFPSILQGKSEMIFSPLFRNWNNDDIRYWNQYYLDVSLLEYFRIFPLYSLHINKRIIYLYSYQDPGYIFKTISKDSADYWECYFPRRDKKKQNRFLRNHRFIGGLNLIENRDYGVITKSRKDVACLALFDINAVHLAGETTMPLDWEFDIIKKKWKTVYSLLDFDYAGIRTSRKLRRLGIIPIFFTNGMYGTLDFESKDFSDYLMKNKWNQTEQLVDYIKDEGINLTYDFVDFFNSLHK